MALPDEHLLDELAIPYVQVVAAAAGAIISIGRRDYGVDGSLRTIVKLEDGRYFDSGVSIDYQLKGTTRTSIDGETISYDLRVRNYDAIVNRGRNEIPFYLFSGVLSSRSCELDHAQRECVDVERVCLLVDPSGGPAANVGSVRVKIGTRDRLTPDAIQGMLATSQERFV